MRWRLRSASNRRIGSGQGNTPTIGSKGIRPGAATANMERGGIMPRLVSDRDREVEAILAAREEFEAGFTRSKKGNLTRRWEGLQVTVFQRGERFSWSIAGDGETRFSPNRHEDEWDALSALAGEL